MIHHVGLRVADIERAATFYREALGATWMVLPMPLEGDAARLSMGVDRLRLAMLSLGNAAVELFELPQPPTPGESRLPHLAIQVEDTDAALERVEQLGGTRIWEQVDRLGRARVIYVRDPDGNVVELLDHPPEVIAGALHRWFPDSKP
jgi:catechol 2,3-dioxygenase-like lactoylglutathione lyase family enzyme